MTDEPTQEGLDDATVEDTVHCCVCGASFTLGGNDGVCLDGAEVRFRPECNGAFCVECARLVHNAYREALRQAGVCEHGVADGDWCPDCSREYRRARESEENQ